MSLVNLSVKDLLLDDKNLTFLVGAGCSVESPSCQPHTKAMMEAIIRYTCAESEIEKILDLENLGFETLLAIIQDQFDPDLKIIDYYELCDKPNILHYFLAEMINKGNIVLTTNFDFLIESALMELNIPKKQIVPIITGKDFLKFRDPLRLLKKKKNIIYKVHGSTKNIITKEDTRDSLINSILAIGLNEGKSDIFQLQPTKYLSLRKAMKDRSLIIMGYSGNNDFDIIPTIKVIENIQNIIWINHIEEYEDKEKIYEINSEYVNNTDKLADVDKILVDIYQIHNTNKIYRVDTNAGELLRKLDISAGINNITEVKYDPEISQDIFLINPIDWFKDNIKKPSEFNKYIIPQKIYSYYDKCDDTLRCFKKILHILEESEGPDLRSQSTAIDNIEFMFKERKNYSIIIDWFQKTKSYLDQLQDHTIKAALFNLIGLIYLKQGIYPKAFDCFKAVFEIYSDLDDLKGIAESLKNIGMVYQGQLKYSEAIRFYKDALNIVEKSKLQEKKAEILNIKGVILQDEPNYSKALKCFEKALAIFEQKEDFEGKIISLYNIGFNNHYEGNDSKALEKLEEALQIAEQTGNLQRKILCLKAMGHIYRDQWDLLKAIKKFKEALEIADQLEYLEEQVEILNIIGSLHQVLKYYPEALDYFQKSLSVAERLENLEIKANCLYNIAVIFFEERNHKEALMWFEEALEIDEMIENSMGKAQRLVSIGNIHKIEGEYDKALEKLREALEIESKLKSLSEKAKIMRMIGMIYQKQKDFEDALAQYDQAFQIFNHLDDLAGKASCLNNIGLIYITLQDYPEALNCFEEAIQIDEQLKDLPGKAIHLYNLGIINHNQKKYHKALKQYEKAIEIYEQLGDLSGKITCLNNIGLLYQDQRDYDKALKQYDSVMKFQKFDVLEYTKEIAKAFYYIALIYHDQENFNKALQHYDKAFQTFNQLNDLSDLATCLYNIGNIYHVQENLSEAMKNYKDALHIYEQIDDLWGSATCNNNIGLIYQNNKKYNEALRYFEDAIKIYDALDDKERKAKTLVNIGSIHFYHGKYRKALKCYEKALNIGEIKLKKVINDNIKTTIDNLTVKQILEFEYKNRRDIPPKKWVETVNSYMIEKLNIGIKEVKYYHNLINKSIDYKKNEIEELNSLGGRILKKVSKPTLYDLVVNLKLNLETAKKVGKFLKNNKTIDKFPIIPAKSPVVSVKADIIQVEEELIKRIVLPKLLEKSSRRMLEKHKGFKEKRLSMVNFKKKSNDFDYREITDKMREFLIL